MGFLQVELAAVCKGTKDRLLLQLPFSVMKRATKFGWMFRASQGFCLRVMLRKMKCRKRHMLMYQDARAHSGQFTTVSLNRPSTRPRADGCVAYCFHLSCKVH